jgi:flagellar biosynthesis component FlhA/type III secretion system FlhB-like substrate exporter
MFYETLNKCIITWIESGKLKYLFSNKRKPDFVITDKMDLAVALKYNAEEMIAPVVLTKSRNSYTQKITRLCSEKNIPIVEDKELANDLYSNVRVGQTIPDKNYEKVALIYANHVNKKIINDESNLSFTNTFDIQRDKKYETLSVKQPDKIQLELSPGVFNIVGQRRFVIDINGLSIHNIKIREDTNLKYDGFKIVINGLPVEYGIINHSDVDPFDQLTVHLSEALKNFTKDLIGRDEVVHFISRLKNEAPVLIDEVMKFYSVGEIRKVLQELLKENVSIRNLITILETMADLGLDNHNIELIIESVRESIGRSICLPYLCNGNLLRGIGFKFEFEKLINENACDIRGKKMINDKYFRILSKTLSDALNMLEEKAIKPIIICNLVNRRLIKKVTELFNMDAVVLSASEIPKDVKVEYVLEMKGN